MARPPNGNRPRQGRGAEAPSAPVTLMQQPSADGGASKWSPMVALPYAAAVILSVISFHTTFIGMRSFYGLGSAAIEKDRISDPFTDFIRDYLHLNFENILAFCFAMIVQGGIFFAGAFLFKLLLNSRIRGAATGPAHASTWVRRFVMAILLLLLPISIYFSYAARLEWQIGKEEKGKDQANEAQNDATNIMRSVKLILVDEKKRLNKDAISVAEYATWTTAMNRLVKAVASSNDPIQKYLSGKREEQDKRRDAERQQQVTAQNKQLEFQQQADKIGQEKAALEDKIKKLEAAVRGPSPLTAEFDKLIDDRLTKMEAAKTDGSDGCSGGVAGEGKCYKQFKAEHDEAVKRKEAYQQKARDDVVAEKKKLNETVARQEKVLDDAKRAGHTIKQDNVATKLDIAADLPRKITELAPIAGKRGTELAESLASLQGGFTLDAFKVAMERCKELIPLSLLDGIDKEIKGTECEPKALAPAIAAVESLQGRESQFDKECAGIARLGRTDKPEEYITKVLVNAELCLDRTQLGNENRYRDQAKALSDQLAALRSQRSVGINYLAYTWEKLRKGQQSAPFAFFVASAVDALVLVFTFLGELPRMGGMGATTMPLNEDERRRMFRQLQAVSDGLETVRDAPQFKSVKALFNCLDPPGPDGFMRLDLAKVKLEEERLDLRRRLVPLEAAGVAWRDLDRPSTACISERGMSSQLRRYSAGRAATNSATVSMTVWAAR